MAGFAAGPRGRVGPRVVLRLAARHEQRLGSRGRAVRAASRTHFRRNPRGRASSRAADRPRLVYLTSVRRTSPGGRKISRDLAGKRAARSRACPRASDPSASAFSGRLQRAFGASGPAGRDARPGFLETRDPLPPTRSWFVVTTTRLGRGGLGLGLFGASSRTSPCCARDARDVAREARRPTRGMFGSATRSFDTSLSPLV